STLYIVGGLYGNTGALRAIRNRLLDEDETSTAVIFNGDFHYFDIAPDQFNAISEIVDEYYATKGNIEAELDGSNGDAGCGCGYPEYVADAMVERSNLIVDRLRHTAKQFAAHAAKLSQLPRFMTAR